MRALLLLLPILSAPVFFMSAAAGNAAAFFKAESIDSQQVAKCLDALSDPSPANAAKTTAVLRQLAQSQQGDSKQATEQLANLVENLFAAEKRVAGSKAGIAMAERAAKDSEASAKFWLTPNGLGNTSPTLGNKALEGARSIRAAAAKKAGEARQNLVFYTKAADDAIRALEQAGKKEAAASLATAVQSVVARSQSRFGLPGGTGDEFQNDLMKALVVGGLLWAASEALSGGGLGGSSGNMSQHDLEMQRGLEMQMRNNRRSQEESDERREREAAALRAQDEARKREMDFEDARRRAAQAEEDARRRANNGL